MSPDNNVSPLQSRVLRNALHAYDSSRDYDDLLGAARLVIEKRLSADPVIERIKRDYHGALEIAVKFLSSMDGDSDLLSRHLVGVEKLIEGKELRSLEDHRMSYCWPALRSICQWLEQSPVTCLFASSPIESKPVAEPDPRLAEVAKAIAAVFPPPPDSRIQYFPAARDSWDDVAVKLGQFDPLPTIISYVESLFPDDDSWINHTSRTSESDAGRILMVQGLICAAVDQNQGQESDVAASKEIALAILGGLLLFGSDQSAVSSRVFLALMKGNQPLFDVAMHYWLLAFENEEPQPGWPSIASILLDLKLIHETQAPDQDDLAIRMKPTFLARHVAAVYCAYLNDNDLDSNDEETLGYGIDRARQRLGDLAKSVMRAPVSIDQLGLVAAASQLVGNYSTVTLYGNLWLGLAHEFDESQAGFPTTLSLSVYPDRYTPDRKRWPVARSLLQSVYELKIDELGDALLCWFLITESAPNGPTLSSIWSDLESYVRNSLKSPRHEMVVHSLELASCMSGMRDDALGERLLRSMLTERDRQLLRDHRPQVYAVPSIRMPTRPHDSPIGDFEARLCNEAQNALKSALYNHQQLAPAIGIHLSDCGTLATAWFKPIEIELKHRLKGLRYRTSFKVWCEENGRDPNTFATLVCAIQEYKSLPKKIPQQVYSACGALADDCSLLDDILALARKRNEGSHKGSFDVGSYADFISLLFGEKNALRRFIDSLPDRA